MVPLEKFKIIILFVNNTITFWNLLVLKFTNSIFAVRRRKNSSFENTMFTDWVGFRTYEI